MLVKTKDDQRYGMIQSIVVVGKQKQGKSQEGVYMVQCYYGQQELLQLLPRVEPCWLRKCTVTKTFSTAAVALAVGDVVLLLLGCNHRDKKTGTIAYQYNRHEKYQLLQNSDHCKQVPDELIQLLQEEGCDEDPLVSFDDDSIRSRYGVD